MQRIIRIAALALIACVLSTSLFAAGNFMGDLKTMFKSKSAGTAETDQPKSIWFTLYLRNNKTIECIDISSPYSPEAIKVVTDYESVNKIKLKYIKYLDFAGTNKSILENEWGGAKTDIIHLVNSDVVSGIIRGFSGDACKIETPYGTHNIKYTGIDYIIVAKRVEKPKSGDKEKKSDPMKK